jgi:hypothetical protein
MIAAITAATALFFALWWILIVGGDETPWVPAGLTASVVLLVALSAREVVMRRAWTRYLLENSVHEGAPRVKSDRNPSKKTNPPSLHSATLAAIQKQANEADAALSPELHLEVFHLCQNYLESTEEALHSNTLPPEKRNALRAGQERVRILEKHHLLTWARDSSRGLTHEAQRRVRISDKIETAGRALECLDSALRVFPEEQELNESKLAIRDFIASVKVAHWVELAERAAFKGHYRRAIDRYKDALFYLERESVKDDVRKSGAERINREIELLRVRLKSSRSAHNEKSAERMSDRAGTAE